MSYKKDFLNSRIQDRVYETLECEKCERIKGVHEFIVASHN